MITSYYKEYKHVLYQAMQFLIKFLLCYSCIAVSVVDACPFSSLLHPRVDIEAPLREYTATIHETTEQEVSYIIHTLASSSLFSLRKNKIHLQKAASQLYYLHPLSFLKIILNNPSLKKDALDIKKRFWMWAHFSKKITQSLEREQAHNNLLPHIAQFCESLQLDDAVVTELIEKNQWEELIHYLF